MRPEAVSGGLAAALIGLGLASAAQAFPKQQSVFDRPKPPTPIWLQKPSEMSFRRVFPARATSDHVTGTVVLRCQVTPARTLAGCVPNAEDPPGYGFADAALKLAAEFHLTPPGPDKPANGATINVPIRFLGWAYRQPPVFNMRPGDAAILMTELKGARPHTRSIFPCPDVEPERRRYCLWSPVVWTSRPDKAAIRSALAESDLLTGKSTLTCSAAPDGRLTGCRTGGEVTPRGDAALLALAKDFRVAPTAKDGTPVSQGWIVIEIDWPVNRAAAIGD